jgi:hypothetical protein
MKLPEGNFPKLGKTTALRSIKGGILQQIRRNSRSFFAAGKNISLIMFLVCLSSLSAEAHVKWFAPYIVNAAPRPIAMALSDIWFWIGIALVLIFFIPTIILERTALGSKVTEALNKVSDPLCRRADDFMRSVIAAFFIALFAVGGVYLTPDLKTSHQALAWGQLLIAMGMFSRKTMPLSAVGIILLWFLALREYDFFHLLDYLSLGLGVAGYILLASYPNHRWHALRFEVLACCVAIALMWSSLEKFAYPEWFYSLVTEKPFMTFGMPRDIFLPMAGVAEFAMGFGLLWSPLTRKLSAAALLIIFTAAVFPFGRIDLVGHSLIMATLVLVFADPARIRRMAEPRRLVASIARLGGIG